MALYPRLAASVVVAALADTRVVFLRGPRQAGKTTLVRQLTSDASWPARYVTLDTAAARAAAARDPEGFVAALPTPVAIDEVQRVPALVTAIKARVDEDTRPGQFLLTGSSNVFAIPQVAADLVGRVETVTLWPLAQAEIERSRGGFVDTLLTAAPDGLRAPVVDRGEAVRRVLRGGFPEAVGRASTRRDAWFRSYVTDVVDREIRSVSEIEGWREIPTVLRLLAARGPGLVNMADLARDAQIARRTLARYVALLEQAFLVHTVPAWTTSLVTRLVKSPRAVITDAGLAAHLVGVSASRIDSTPELLGPLLKTFVLSELRRLADVSTLRPRLHHFRTHEGLEVDALLETGDGRIAAIEVKASTSLGPRDFKPMRTLGDLVGARLARGVLLYLGREIVGFGPRLCAMPLSALWSN